MGNWNRQQIARDETNEKNRTRRGKLAGYLFNLSQITFAGLVVGSFATLFTGDSANLDYVAYPIIVGSIATFLLAWLGNRMLKI